jgi:hypothetical protein
MLGETIPVLPPKEFGGKVPGGEQRRSPDPGEVCAVFGWVVDQAIKRRTYATKLSACEHRDPDGDGGSDFGRIGLGSIQLGVATLGRRLTYAE